VLRLTAVVTALSAPPFINAGDWPQWRGPQRNGVSAERVSLAGWPADGAPPVAWQAAVGKGHSAAVVSRGRVFTMGWDGQQDTVYCFDAGSGALRWQQSYPSKTIFQWPGPRATPTVDGDVVYTLGQWGRLNAWDAATGKNRWSVPLPESYNPDIDYGFAWSPLVEGDLLILAAGKNGLAIDKNTGRFAWGNDGQHGACASPVPYQLAGRRGVALITTNPGRDSVSLVGVDPRSGMPLWRSAPWEEKWGAACVDLLVAEGKVFITTAEQHLRCARLSIRDHRLEEDWSNKNLSTYTGGCVLLDGHIYAVDKRGILKCLDWTSGELKWHERGFGEFGALTAADGQLIIQNSDNGEVVVAEASPHGFRPLRRTKVFAENERTFTVPVLANGRLYCRSYQGELVCLRIDADE
jgi:outer membrane protein assembly factor BamB